MLLNARQNYRYAAWVVFRVDSRNGATPHLSTHLWVGAELMRQWMVYCIALADMMREIDETDCSALLYLQTATEYKQKAHIS